MASNTSQIVSQLKAVIKDLEAKRDGEIEAVRKRYQKQIGDIQKTIDGLQGGPLDPDLDYADVHLLSISDERLDMVRQFVREHPSGVRQADIGPATGLNSGSVSVALRRLKKTGEVEPGRMEKSSRLWLPTRVAINAA